MAGRISDLTEEMTAEIIKVVSEGMPYKYAIESVGIAERTFFRWLARGRKETSGIYWQFSQDIKKARSEAIKKNVKNVQDAGEKSWQASAWWLERQFPEEFGSDSRTIRELRKLIEQLTAKKK